jgi:hypothetical protein
MQVPNEDSFKGDEVWHLREQIKDLSGRLTGTQARCTELHDEVKFLRTTVLNLSERKRK